MRNKEGFVLGLVFFLLLFDTKKLTKQIYKYNFYSFFTLSFFPIAEVTLKVKETSQRDK